MRPVDEPPRPYPQPDDPIGSCDGGDCDDVGVAWVWLPVDGDYWLPACPRHVELAVSAGGWTVQNGEVHHWERLDEAAEAIAHLRREGTLRP